VIADRMIKALGGIATCAFALSIALPSAAAETDLYVEYSGGVSFVPNQRISGADAPGSNLSGHVESDTGFNVGAAFGARFYEYFRAELQITYRESEVSNLSLQGEPDDAQGHVGLVAIMANGYFDYDLGIGVVPYLGAGVGWGSVEIDAKNKSGTGQTRIEGEDSIFVWSLMAGGTYPINEVLDLSLGYRYIATTDPDINSDIGGLGSTRLEAEFEAHEIVLGLRFNF
jgi:OOP family OmpA-OmpF porin